MNEIDVMALLKAAGVWDSVAAELARNHPVERITQVVDYCINQGDYRNPPAAIVAMLRRNIDIPQVDLDQVNKLLGEVGGDE